MSVLRLAYEARQFLLVFPTREPSTASLNPSMSPSPSAFLGSRKCGPEVEKPNDEDVPIPSFIVTGISRVTLPALILLKSMPEVPDTSLSTIVPCWMWELVMSFG